MYTECFTYPNSNLDKAIWIIEAVCLLISACIYHSKWQGLAKCALIYLTNNWIGYKVYGKANNLLNLAAGIAHQNIIKIVQIVEVLVYRGSDERC